jgi:hypothetical protein
MSGSLTYTDDEKIMPWIKQIPTEEATGLLKSQVDAAL